MKTKWLASFVSALLGLSGWALAQTPAPTVKITALGSHTGELCQDDRGFLFEDPTGVRILFDPGRAVAGAEDARLGDIHVVLLSHAHGDHIGDRRIAKLNAGTCDKPETVSAAPNSNFAEIAAAKNSVMVLSNDMGAFLGKKVQTIKGAETKACPTAGLARETTVPQPAACTANLQLGGKRTVKLANAAKGVQIALVMADHSNNAPRALLTEPQKTNLEADNLSAYVGHANGYVVTFSNGLKVYMSGDTAVMGDMKTILNGYYKVNLAIVYMGSSAMQGEETAFAVNELIQPKAVMPSHVNEAATKDGKVLPGTKTGQFIDLVKGRTVYVPLSGKTFRFDGNAKCVGEC